MIPASSAVCDDRPLGRRSCPDLLERLGFAGEMAVSRRGARGDVLAGHIDHSRTAARVDMRQSAHAQSCLSRGTCPASEQGR